MIAEFKTDRPGDVAEVNSHVMYWIYTDILSSEIGFVLFYCESLAELEFSRDAVYVQVLHCTSLYLAFFYFSNSLKNTQQKLTPSTDTA